MASSRKVRKDIFQRVDRILLGNGLLLSEGDFWLRQRRLAQPAFHRDRIQGYGRVMIDHTREMLAGWRDGDRRDLVAEMAQALNAKGIKLMCYFPTHVVGKYPNASSKEFTQMTSDILKEFGERYGEKVVGYWFDGFYQCFEKYPDFSFRDFFKVCKAGNSKRIIAVNSWIYPNVTEW